MPSALSTYLYIGLGSALGGVARYACSNWVGERIAGSFPWGTLLVNVTGCFVIGLVAALDKAGGRWQLSPLALQFLMVGVLGGYTTFSAFSLQTLTLLRAGAWLSAGTNVLASVLLSLLAVWLGYWLMTSFHLARA